MECETEIVNPDLNAIIQCVRRVGKLDPLNPTTDMYSAGLRSIDALTLLMELEEAFGISLPDEQFIACRTPKDLLELIDNLRNR